MYSEQISRCLIETSIPPTSFVRYIFISRFLSRYIHETCTKHWSCEMSSACMIPGQQHKGKRCMGLSKCLSAPLNKCNPWGSDVAAFTGQEGIQVIRSFCRVCPVKLCMFGRFALYEAQTQLIRGLYGVHHFHIKDQRSYSRLKFFAVYTQCLCQISWFLS